MLLYALLTLPYPQNKVFVCYTEECTYHQDHIKSTNDYYYSSWLQLEAPRLASALFTGRHRMHQHCLTFSSWILSCPPSSNALTWPDRTKHSCEIEYIIHLSVCCPKNKWNRVGRLNSLKLLSVHLCAMKLGEYAEWAVL